MFFSHSEFLNCLLSLNMLSKNYYPKSWLILSWIHMGIKWSFVSTFMANVILPFPFANGSYQSTKYLYYNWTNYSFNTQLYPSFYWRSGLLWIDLVNKNNVLFLFSLLYPIPWKYASRIDTIGKLFWVYPILQLRSTTFYCLEIFM